MYLLEKDNGCNQFASRFYSNNVSHVGINLQYFTVLSVYRVSLYALVTIQQAHLNLAAFFCIQCLLFLGRLFGTLTKRNAHMAYFFLSRTLKCVKINVGN